MQCDTGPVTVPEASGLMMHDVLLANTFIKFVLHPSVANWTETYGH